MNIECVVSRFYENTEWTAKLNASTIVYNKNSKDVNLYTNNLPNIGREGHTFLTHVANNYDKLADYTAFMQGNPFDHCPDVINLINSFNFKTSCLPLGIVYERDKPVVLNPTKDFAAKLNLKYQQPIMFVSGTQCIVSRELLHKKDRQAYIDILNEYKPEPFTIIDYWIEYLLPTIFGFNEEIIPYRYN